MLNRKLNGYKITNMKIIKNTIKIIVILVAAFIVINIFWWLFGGMIGKMHISPLVVTKTITNVKDAPNCLLQKINIDDEITYQGEQWIVSKVEKNISDYYGDNIYLIIDQKNPRNGW